VKEYEVIYIGKGFSLNDFYSQGHYSIRNNLKNKYGKIFRSLIDEVGVPPMQQYKLSLKFNSRHDPSNMAAMIKVFEDCMVGMKKRKSGFFTYDPLVPDDSKKYCKGIYIEPDLELKTDTFVFTIHKIK
jgi:hypothetical protein